MSIFSFIFSVAVLYFVLRYRVHITLTIQSEGLADKPRRRVVKAQPQSVLADLTSALRNLGCDKPKALRIASRVYADGQGDFDGMLRQAIQEAAA